MFFFFDCLLFFVIFMAIGESFLGIVEDFVVEEARLRMVDPGQCG